MEDTNERLDTQAEQTEACQADPSQADAAVPARSDADTTATDAPDGEAPEDDVPEEKRAFWEAACEAVRDEAANRHYLTLTDLCARAEMERDEVRTLMEEARTRPEYADVYVYEGAKDLYYYIYPTLAHNYVRGVAMAQENDLPRIIAEVVRYESKIYPRATDITTFTRFPYHYTVIQVRRMLERMALQSEYADLERYTSGKKNEYIFSTRYLSRRYATFLVEQSEDKRIWL